MRYQIVYSRSSYPLTTWAKSQEEATKKAGSLRTVGYSVDVWEHTKTGCRKSAI